MVKEVAPEDVEELLKNLNQGKREISSFAELMSSEDAERYLKFLEKGSTDGLTGAELEKIKKVDALLALNMVDYQDILDIRNAKNVLESGSGSGKIWDYLKQFDGELINFNDGYEIKNVVDKDLYLVQFHSDAKVGSGRSLKYWTTFDERMELVQ